MSSAIKNNLHKQSGALVLLTIPDTYLPVTVEMSQAYLAPVIRLTESSSRPVTNKVGDTLFSRKRPS